MTRRVVEKGEEILRCRKAGSGYFRAPAEVTGLYIGPEEPILTKEELQLALSVIEVRESMIEVREAEAERARIERSGAVTVDPECSECLNAGGDPEGFGGDDFDPEAA